MVNEKLEVGDSKHVVILDSTWGSRDTTHAQCQSYRYEVL